MEPGWLAFVILYCGSFKFLNCFLNRLFCKDSKKNTLMAGYLSGICYIFYPRFTLISFALVRVAQLLWMKNIADYDGRNDVLKKLKDLPMGYIVLATTVSFLFSSRVMFPYLSSKYIVMCLNYVSGTL